ncbi:MAG: helix-turn-helix domain-containing protein [Acidobacteriota bacterium]
MRYAEHPPSADLAPLVACHWILEATAAPAQRIVPDGSPELVLHWGESFRRRHDDGRRERQPRCLVFGQLRGPLQLEPEGRVGVLGVRFHPAGAARLLRVPLAELTDLGVASSDLWGDAATRELEQRLADASDDGARVTLVEGFLRQRLALTSETDVDQLLRVVTGRLAATQGRASVATLADQLAVGRRRLERAFAKGVGVSPKQLARVFRFQSVHRLAEVSPELSWSELALRGGYADQAHLCREWKEMTGLSPTAWKREQHEMARLFAAG